MDKARDAELNLFALHCLVTANRASNSWNRHSVLESVSTGVQLLLDLGQDRKNLPGLLNKFIVPPLVQSNQGHTIHGQRGLFFLSHQPCLLSDIELVRWMLPVALMANIVGFMSLVLNL